ncbi:MAG: DUF192 domain-containing protein [Planctomycetaceae bacterium]|nr:DUF192 domain-containing protein [Planctomycetaceae bacterium]
MKSRSISRPLAALAAVSGCSLLAAFAPPPVDAPPPGETPKTAPQDGTPAPTPPASPKPPASKQKPATVPTKDDVVDAKPRTDLPKERIVLLGEQFDTEFCFDEASRATGMGGRSEFPEGTAMIFVHPRAIMLNYWMKDCLIDLDMIFVDAKGRVTAIHEATREKLRTKGETKDRYESRLYLYGSRSPAQFVIELPAGSLKRLKPMIGQQLGLDWARYAQRAK